MGPRDGTGSSMFSSLEWRASNDDLICLAASGRGIPAICGSKSVFCPSHPSSARVSAQPTKGEGKEIEKNVENLNPIIHKIISVNHSMSSTEYTALIIYESDNNIVKEQ